MNAIRSLWAQKNYRLAIIIASVLSLWMLSGLLKPEREQPARAEPDAVNEPARESVRAAIVRAEPYQRQLRVRARTEPNRAVDVRAETSGRVVALPVAEGASVRKGDLICELAEEDRALKVQEAEVNLRKAQIDFDGSQRLKSQGYQSQSAIAAAEAALSQARSALKRQQLELAYTQLRAPFDGVVNRRPVELGAFMQRGDVCATVIDLDPLVLAGQVAENEVFALKAGQTASGRVNGRQVDGSVRYVSRDAEPQTRAFLMEVAVANPGQAIGGGLTSELFIDLPVQPAHAISPALLALGDEGSVGVKIIDADERVAFMPVTILGDNTRGVWVSGLPDPVTLITVGQEYVAVGHPVDYVLETQQETAAETAEVQP
ncbi:efflux RND transporter periplasmic adaptor subunit [Simiduia agarivorans]|uniref:RND family efflux transporter MFP subunit n=1 Tax=Simiduia agarivorans (strain DSM 21679 / JCM 13881 / BCRC 17597 / SA1) TaxID=1117647 RepID=K4KY42_SIMAS|nr:efflux RND transporter periplasmic adaptor subunit [Simiduia agarivorans]AFU98862.1 RND family efflux transporter MFP subunit [Simiduia agarivorans SA1 = DSM 21679]